MADGAPAIRASNGSSSASSRVADPSACTRCIRGRATGAPVPTSAVVVLVRAAMLRARSASVGAGGLRGRVVPNSDLLIG